MIWTSAFWKDATERAIKTLAQVILALGAAGALNAFQVDWYTVAGIGLGAALLSYDQQDKHREPSEARVATHN